MKCIRTVMATILSLMIVAPVWAQTAQQTAAAQKVIAEKLLKINQNYKIGSFKPAKLDGFYRVQIVNGPKLYISSNGDYMFDGDLYSTLEGKLVNISDQEQASERIALMKELNPKEMIIFSPKMPVKTKDYITVFTDVDCGYCQKLHKEVPELNAHGIEVRYMAFPRAGIGSPTYKKLMTAWCSDNPQDAITRLKNHESLTEKACDNPIAKQYELGKRMGVNGTPAILLKDGTMIPGYRPADDLIKILGI